MNYTEKKITLKRIAETEKQIQGILSIEGEKKVYATIELPNKNNHYRISCIPTGEYIIRPRTSKKYGKHLEVLNVPNRSMILIHAGNYYKQTAGCILVGKEWKDLNNDGEKDITDSKKTLKELTELITKETKLTIINIYEK